MDDFGMAPPPFNPDAALQRLRKDLRDLGLAEREGRFERRGVAIARAAVDDAGIQAAIVKRPSRNSPEWQGKTLKTGADLRDFVAELKKKLAAWGDRDD
jgi:hypothetical protein